MTSQPPLFEMRHGHPALVELDGLYLGQPADEAKRALREYCQHPVRRDSSRSGSDAYFLGCRLTDHETLTSVRIGFWPRIDERVATLEYKRRNLAPAAVHQRYLETVDDKLDKRLSPTSIEITSANYHLFADWDAGRDEPAHVIVGFSPHIPTQKTRPATDG